MSIGFRLSNSTPSEDTQIFALEMDVTCQCGAKHRPGHYLALSNPEA
jgi:hypothetical protein